MRLFSACARNGFTRLKGRFYFACPQADIPAVSLEIRNERAAVGVREDDLARGGNRSVSGVISDNLKAQRSSLVFDFSRVRREIQAESSGLAGRQIQVRLSGGDGF